MAPAIDAENSLLAAMAASELAIADQSGGPGQLIGGSTIEPGMESVY